MPANKNKKHIGSLLLCRPFCLVLDNLTASPAVSAKTVSAKPVVACISKSDIMLFSNNDVSVGWGVRKKALERYHKNVLYL